VWCIEITNLCTSKPVWRSLVAQAICNRQVVGSNPSTGSTLSDSSLASVKSTNSDCNFTVSHLNTTSRQNWLTPLRPTNVAANQSTSATGVNLQPLTKTSTRRLLFPDSDATVPSPADVTDTPTTCIERSSALRYAATTLARRLLIAICEATEPELLV